MRIFALPTKALAAASKFVLVLCCGLPALPILGQPAALPDAKFWFPAGAVNAILVTNDTLYLGGDFSYVGPHTGPVVLFNQATGALLAAPPRISGTLKAAVPDGAGGWFIGGAFTRIGTVAVTNVAHLNADLTPDASWNAKLVGTTVNALALDNGRLYVGGTFTKINGVTLSGGLAGVDAAIRPSIGIRC